MSNNPRFAIIGCGGIGFWLYHMFSINHQNVDIYSKDGEQTSALMAQGIQIHDNNETYKYYPIVSSIDCLLSGYDYVFIAVKDYSIKDLIEKYGAVLNTSSALIFLQNGLPLWLNDMMSAFPEESQTFSCIAKEKIIGGINYTAVERKNDAVYIKAYGPFIIGFDSVAAIDSVKKLFDLMNKMNFNIRITQDIRYEYWYKLYGNIITGPLCTLHQLDVETLLNDPSALEVGLHLLEETLLVARSYGVHIPVSPTDRINQLRYVGPFRSSMLQDKLSRKTIEIEAMLGRLIALADKKAVSIPHLKQLSEKLARTA